MCRMPCPKATVCRTSCRSASASQAAHPKLVTKSRENGKAPTSVSLFEQGLTQFVQAAVTGLEPKKLYVLALSDKPDGSGGGSRAYRAS